jgi:starch phosphorylase
VQLITVGSSGDDPLYDPRVDPFPAGVNIDGGLRRYEGWVEAKRAGAIGYTVRVVPYHPLLASQPRWARGAARSMSTPTY